MTYYVKSHGWVNTVDYSGEFGYEITFHVKNLDYQDIINTVCNILGKMARNGRLYYNQGHLKECNVIIYLNSYVVDFNAFTNFSNKQASINC